MSASCVQSTTSLSQESSLAHSSVAHTSNSASTPHSIHQAPGIKDGRRGSLSLIGSAHAARVRLAKDFRSLVRSNSTSTSISSRYDRGYGRHQRAASAQGYHRSTDARRRDISPHVPLLPESAIASDAESMDKQREESRSGRSFGARLVDFLSRSRSRSRSKKRRSRSLDDIQVPIGEMPKTLQAGSLGRRNHYGTLGESSNTSNSTSASSTYGTKPLTRSPSRPLSGATTATDTTVKPRPKLAHKVSSPKNQTTSASHRVQLQTEVLGSHTQDPSSRTRKANIFSVSIPTTFRNASRDSVGHARRDASGSSSPIPTDQGGRRLWSGRFRSGSGSSTGGQSSRSNGERSAPSDTPPPVPPKPTPSSSKPIRPILVTPQPRRTREDTLNTLASPPPPYNEYEYEPDADLGGRCSPLCGLPSPRLTPVSEKGKERERVARVKPKESIRVERPERVERETRKGKERERDRDIITGPRRVGSPAVRERERESRSAMAVVAPAPIEKVASGSGSGNSKKSKDSGSTSAKAKRTKHGSFDFERPLSVTAGRVVNMRSALRGLGVGHEPSRGNAVQPMERSHSTKERGSRPPGISQPQSSSVGRTAKRPQVDVTPTTLARHPQGTTTNTATSRSHHHPSDHDPMSPTSSHSGQSNSFGKSAGARMLRGTHGAFKFEPAVPTIPGSPASDECTTHVGRGLGSPEPSRLRYERNKAKGRSLDLGLSLSWAPQRVREEAVLQHTQNSNGQHATTSRVRPRWRGETVDEEGRLDAPASRFTSSVAEEFREALGDAAYGTFKTYVHRFDAHAIPLDGPYGLICAASRLLDTAGTLDERGKTALLDRFIRFVRENQ